MGDRVERRHEEYERYFLAELRKLLDLDAAVGGFSKSKGYAKVRRGETWLWEGIGVG